MKKREDPVPIWVYAILIVVVSFFASRYGWKLYGMSQCTNTVIVNQVLVEDGRVTVQGTNPYASSLGAFVGTTYKQEGNKLTIGVKYNSIIGVLPTDQNTFSYEYKVEGEIDTVALQGNGQETIIWQSKEQRDSQICVTVQVNGVLLDAIHYTCYLAGETIASGDIALENARNFSIPLVFMKSDFAEDADMSTFALGFVLKGENQDLEVPGVIYPNIEWGGSDTIVIDVTEDGKVTLEQASSL